MGQDQRRRIVDQGLAQNLLDMQVSAVGGDQAVAGIEVQAAEDLVGAVAVAPAGTCQLQHGLKRGITRGPDAFLVRPAWPDRPSPSQLQDVAAAARPRSISS
jgi:hypothetical protein